MDTEEANKFINSLVKNLQVLCHGHVSFDSSIQVIGHLYLNVDSQTNIDYIVNEKVCKSDNSSTMFVSKSYHSEPQKKEKKNTEKNQTRERRSSSQSETSNDDQNQRNDRLGFGSNYGDVHQPHLHQKTSTPMRRPLHHPMEGPSMKMPRLSHPQSPMSPSNIGSRNSSHPGLRLDNRNAMGDNSSHQFDLSRLQQSNISETSFHLQPHISSNNSQRNTSSSSPSSKTVPVVKQEPVQIDLSNVKSEPQDDDGGTEDMGNEMSNEEFLASLHDKTSSIYPVALHSNETSASNSQLDFNLPISFQQGAGGAGPSFAPDGSAVKSYDFNSLFRTKRRTFIDKHQKKELCLFKEENPNATGKEVTDFFTNRFGVEIPYDTLYKIIKNKHRWLNESDD
ncbi:hypothetical protein LOTGIDRAFT_234871 [Lottia gigantea]|uniref:Uncharacterized protein n=1 Tax=Lottia gigantea TaxID=225164 RepID=V3ZZ28_LOTGI|nr:hypothetical protein LOTGIDRAFT_234871 [Lottia gigantea]ESO87870.1 hypothetical protein LOTGIDRAFT_234871 [Lottia gigantea]